jgi:hypothetical protein
MWKTMHRPKVKLPAANAEAAKACGGGTEQLSDAEMEDSALQVKLCGGGAEQLTDAEMDALDAPRKSSVPAAE